MQRNERQTGDAFGNRRLPILRKLELDETSYAEIFKDARRNNRRNRYDNLKRRSRLVFVSRKQHIS
jgi:hypothetical protein